MLGMAMYAIATAPLIHRLSTDSIKQLWYADDAGAGGKLGGLCNWWDKLTGEGHDFGYFAKSWLVVKEENKVQYLRDPASQYKQLRATAT
jgi:hypothetical protein